jgi:ribonuclease HI
MVVAKMIRYQLDCQSSIKTPGYWQFLLTAPEQAYRLEVRDCEAGMDPQRCQLLAILRGLEAIPHRAEVTLVTDSRYVQQGLRHGLGQWRENDWKWEHFGRMVPVKHGDLWQRIDHVLQFHSLRSIEWEQRSEAATMLAGEIVQLKVHRLALSEQLSSPLHCTDTWRIDPPSVGLVGHHGFQPRHFTRYTSVDAC